MMTEEDFKKDYPVYLKELRKYVHPGLLKVVAQLMTEGADDLAIPKMKTQNDARGFVWCLFKEKCDQLQDG